MHACKMLHMQTLFDMLFLLRVFDIKKASSDNSTREDQISTHINIFDHIWHNVNVHVDIKRSQWNVVYLCAAMKLGELCAAMKCCLFVRYPTRNTIQKKHFYSIYRRFVGSFERSFSREASEKSGAFFEPSVKLWAVEWCHGDSWIFPIHEQSELSLFFDDYSISLLPRRVGGLYFPTELQGALKGASLKRVTFVRTCDK